MSHRIKALVGCISVVLLISTADSFARATGSAASLLKTCLSDKDPGVRVETCSRLIASTSDTKSLERSLNSRARAYRQLGKNENALRDFNRLIEVNPNVAGYYDNRLYTLKDIGRPEDALADANTAVSLAPQHAFVYNSRATILEVLGRYREAVSDYSKAIAIGPPFAYRYNNRGSALLKAGDFSAAIEDFTRTFEMDKGWTSAIRDRGLAYKALGLLDKAKSDLEWCIRAEPNDQVAASALNEIRSALQPSPGFGFVVPPKTAGPVPALTPELTNQKPRLASERRVALVIGNGRYANANPLSNPANDARAVAQVLRDLRFDVIEGMDLDRTGMEHLIRDFLEKVADAQLALVFYAGHGMQVAGKNYLVPVDAKLATAVALRFETVDVDEILIGLDDPTRTSIVILDACRDNPLARSFAARLGAARSGSISSGLAGYPTVGTGTLIAFATAPNQVALDGDTGNSPFTTALVKHLRTPGIEVQQMLTRVRIDVAAATRNRQVPWANSSLLGEVYLAGQ